MSHAQTPHVSSAASRTAVTLTGVSDDPIVALLREVLEEIRGLRADLQRDQRSDRTLRSLSRADRATLSRLLPVIAGAFDSDTGATIAQLFEHPAVVLVLDRSAVQLGQLFHRARGIPVAGYVLTPGAFELHRRVWHVFATV